ncbi:sensor histidine kinase [Sphingomonas sp. GB1N7]|uniref:sensor histidine kinase n=1 Tax=Parasphingomonas caseinilytica TaxID=3096158 RepID=UPI002FC9901E
MTARMTRLWRSTFGLAAIVSVLLALATLAIGGAAYRLTHEALEEQLDHRAATETRALMAEPGSDRLAALATAIRRREAGAQIDHLGYILVDRDGRRIAGTLDAEAPATLGYEEFLHKTNGRIAQSLTSAVPGGGRLVVAADRAALGDTDRDLLMLFAVAFGAMLLLGAGGAWTVGAVTASRLNRIDRAALAIIGGDLQRRMPVDGSGSEFDRVSATLNRMLDRIGALMDNLRQVSSDVAHDLRTPLTRLSHRLDDAIAAGEGSARETAIAAAATQAEELLEIFAALLRISEVEAMGVRRHFKQVRLGDVLSDLLDTYRPDAEAGGHTLIDALDRDVVLNGDRRLLQQLASNLLDNALQHTPRGTTITVTLRSDQGKVILIVADDGPGVDEDDAARLFQRFSRSERSRSTDGHGLGLALVQAIATAHHGRARLLPAPGFAIETLLADIHSDKSN